MRLCNYLLILCSLTVVSCRNHSGIEIKGTIKNASGKKLYFEEMARTGSPALDSVVLGEKGEFAFKTSNHDFDYYNLRIGENFSIPLIADSASKIEVDADFKDRYSFAIKGNEDSKLLKEFNDSLLRFHKEINKINSLYREKEAGGKTNMDSLGRVLQHQYRELEEERSVFARHFVDRHSSSLMALTATQFLDLNRDFSYYQKVDSLLLKKYPRSRYLQEFHQRVSELSTHLSVHSMAPEIEGQTPEGKNIKLSDLKGRYVVVDFWASWCKPCLAEMPDLVAFYERHKKSVEIFSFSLDNNKDSWVKEIAKNKITWKQCTDYQEWKSPVIRSYFIEAIPYMLLLDKEGRIIAKGISVKYLDKFVKDLEDHGA